MTQKHRSWQKGICHGIKTFAMVKSHLSLEKASVIAISICHGKITSVMEKLHLLYKRASLTTKFQASSARWRITKFCSFFQSFQTNQYQSIYLYFKSLKQASTYHIWDMTGNMTCYDITLHDAYHVIWCYMTWHEMTWNDIKMIWHDRHQNDMKWHEITCNDMTYEGVVFYIPPSPLAQKVTASHERIDKWCMLSSNIQPYLSSSGNSEFEML